MKSHLYRGDCKIIADALIEEGIKADLIYLDPLNSPPTIHEVKNDKKVQTEMKV